VSITGWTAKRIEDGPQDEQGVPDQDGEEAGVRLQILRFEYLRTVIYYLVAGKIQHLVAHSMLKKTTLIRRLYARHL